MLFEKDRQYAKKMLMLALPVAMQSVLQSSILNFADQLMVGQLGSANVAGIGIASKFVSIFSVVISAIASAIAIIISQNIGQNDESDVSEGFWTGVLSALCLGSVFFCSTAFFSKNVMSFYSNDSLTVSVAAGYIKIFSVSFFLMAAATMMMTMLRCLEHTKIIMVSGIVSAVFNVSLNYILIFGKFGIAPMGAKGAAIGTVLGHFVNCTILLVSLCVYCKKEEIKLPFGIMKRKSDWIPFIKMFIPVVAGSLLWSIGDNVYTAIYGHLGTAVCAAITLMLPLQEVVIGFARGIYSASGVIVSKALGTGDFEKSYKYSMTNIIYGFLIAVSLSAFLAAISGFYPTLFNVESETMELTKAIILIFAIFGPIKFVKMIILNGIIKCGGNTAYAFAVDVGSIWLVGVPATALAAFVFNLPVAWVYFIGMSADLTALFAVFIVMKSKKWMAVLPD